MKKFATKWHLASNRINGYKPIWLNLCCYHEGSLENSLLLADSVPTKFGNPWAMLHWGDIKSPQQPLLYSYLCLDTHTGGYLEVI